MPDMAHGVVSESDPQKIFLEGLAPRLLMEAID